MTEMVFGTVPVRDGEPILPRWWRTIDKLSMTCVLLLFSIGILLGLAASPPLASRNGFEAFHYVQRQAVFGGLALSAMVLTSMMSPQLVRRLGVLGFFCAFAALAMLPVFGTDFGKGAVRWYSLGFASLQPSEFLKPGLIIMTAWLMAAAQEINGPPGKSFSFAHHADRRGLPGDATRFRAGLSGAVRLGGDVFRGRRALYPADRDRRGRDAGGHLCLQQFRTLRPSHRRVPEPGGRSDDAAWICGRRDPRGRVLWRRRRRGTCEMVAARRAHRFHHRGGGRGIRADPGAVHHPFVHDDHRAVAAAAGARTRPVHPAGGHRAGLYLRGAGDDQHGRRGAAVAGQGHDVAVRSPTAGRR